MFYIHDPEFVGHDSEGMAVYRTKQAAPEPKRQFAPISADRIERAVADRDFVNSLICPSA